MSTTVCLLCNGKREVTVCGDNSCPCTGGPHWANVRPIGATSITGMGFRGGDGITMVVRPCGRMVPERTERRLEAAR